MQRSWEGPDALASSLAALQLSGLHQGKFAQGVQQHGDWHHGAAPQPHMVALPPELAHQLAAPPAFRGAAPPAVANGYHHAAAPPPPSAPPSMGWGGQAIPENGTFKAPWFGKSRGRGGPAGGRGRGRGRGAPGAGPGGAVRRGGYRRDGAGGLGGPPDELSIDSLVALVAATPAQQPIGEAVYQALFQLDGRACALLLKDLSKAGLQFRRVPRRAAGRCLAPARWLLPARRPPPQSPPRAPAIASPHTPSPRRRPPRRRATELFDWIRALDGGHPLQALLDVYSYTAMISLCITEHDVDRALKLAGEMKAKGIERNVHTCARCGPASLLACPAPPLCAACLSCRAAVRSCAVRLRRAVPCCVFEDVVAVAGRRAATRAASLAGRPLLVAHACSPCPARCGAPRHPRPLPAATPR